jgi:hypothetical protein
MIRARFKKVVVVAPEIFPVQLVAGYHNVKHVRSAGSIFPAIHEFKPDLVIFDYDFVSKDMEKILRRISVNKFYSNIVIHCLRNDRNTKIDDLLKTLGVDQVIYRENLVKSKKENPVLDAMNTIIDNSMATLATSVSN